jgi:hypothetical protein
MEPEVTWLDLGSSLPVPCVQELAKETTATVPPRYVRPDQEPPNLSDSTASLPQVPVIDMQKLFSPEFMDSELEKMHHASKEWGFFQVTTFYISWILEWIRHEFPLIFFFFFERVLLKLNEISDFLITL